MTPVQARPPEKCYNCFMPIGNLEEADIFQDHVVCPSCYQRLNRGANPPRKRAHPVAKFLTYICLFGLLVSVGVVAYGYGTDNAELGGTALLAGGGCAVGFVIFGVMAYRSRKIRDAYNPVR